LTWIKIALESANIMRLMDTLTRKEVSRFAALLNERKQRLLEEIRAVLARSGAERYADLVGEAGDAGDQSVADLLRDVAHAEVARDVGEVRDIVGAESRIAAGTYGVCIDCGAAVGQPRLTAYPSAKRCFRCQEIREKTRASAPRSTL
jgi:RNA polymerase-binding transcription factor DksA